MPESVIRYRRLMINLECRLKILKAWPGARNRLFQRGPDIRKAWGGGGGGGEMGEMHVCHKSAWS